MKKLTDVYHGRGASRGFILFMNTPVTVAKHLGCFSGRRIIGSRFPEVNCRKIERTCLPSHLSDAGFLYCRLLLHDWFLERLTITLL